jgi:flagellar motor switch protein FliN/FliY
MWSENLAQALGQIAGSPFPCAAFPEAPADFPPPAATDVWLTATVSGSLRGEMSMRLPSASAAQLAQTFMGEAAIGTAEVNPELTEALVELMRQVGGLVASAIKAAWGEVQLHIEASATSPSWPASTTAWLRAAKEGIPPAWVEVQLSAALVASLRPAEAAPPPQTTSVQSASAAGTENDPRAGKLDLLMDVELAVTLRFGSRRLLLREILELNPGAVIELDRQVQEPVDVLLDGRIVARGEVVVMEGNYGLRVTEVAPQQ